MKKFTEKGIVQKIIIALIIVILFQFCMPPKVQAIDIFGPVKEAIWEVFTTIGENILVGSARLVAIIGDLLMSAMNNWMLGTAGYGTAMLSQEALDNPNGNSWFHSDIKPEGSAGSDISVEEEEGNTVVYVPEDYIASNPAFNGSDGWEIPNLLYCPENIFGNNISMLDVNFLNPNTYTSVIESGRGKDTADKKKVSIADSLKNTISNWYKAFRNIAIVALLSILVYLGIRILICSTAEDKAKYKESIKDWIVALCLVFLMHFIMSATIMVVNQINALFVNTNSSVYVNVGGTTFRSNFMGVLRFLAQANEATDAWAYTIMYGVLIFYTISFTIQYLKRVLYIAFYTMISPLVAITYPIDKLGDGKSQAFNMWFKEYIMTMILQPIHLILYTMLVSSAITLSIESPLYAIVAIGFLIPAEQFIKKLFGVQSTADGGFGSFASGALAMNAMNKLKPIGPGNAGKGGNSGKEGKGSDKEEDNDSNIRQVSNPELDTYRGRGGDDETSNNTDDTQEDNPIIGNNTNNTQNPYDPLDDGTDIDFNNINTDGWDSDSVLDDYNSEGGSQNIEGEYFNPYTDEYDSSYDPHQDAYDISTMDEGIPLSFNEQTATQNNKMQEQEQSENSQPQEDTRMENNNIHNNNAPAMTEEEKAAKKKAIKGVYNARKRAVWGSRLKKMGGGLGRAGLAATKFGLKATGAALGGTIGVAAGIATGKGLSGAVQGAAAGLAAGSVVGTSAYNLGERGVRGVAGVVKADLSDRKQIKQLNRDMEIDIRKATEGEEEAARYAKENFKPNAEQKKRYKQIEQEYTLKTGKALTKEEKKNFADRIYDYESHNVTDTKQIVKGLKLENELKNDSKYQGMSDEDIHNSVVGVTSFAQTHGREYLFSDKKKKEFDSELNTIGVRNEKQQDEVKDIFYRLHGEKYVKEKTPRNQQSSQRTQQRQPRNNNQGQQTNNNNTSEEE